MEQAPIQTAPAAPVSRTTPKDFFLWLGAIIAFYGSITSFLTLMFQYVNYAYPDALAGYGDPYGGAVRAAMATLIVLVPTSVLLFSLIRASIRTDAGKARIWVRRWAVVLTLFIAAAVMLIDLITLITTFLGGEITTRFTLKALTVLLTAAGVFLHFLADARGYWVSHPRRAQAVGIGFGSATLAAIVAGFFIIGTPAQARQLRYDQQKVYDLESIQYQVLAYWQQKRELPATLDALADPLAGYAVPRDAQSDEPYGYEQTGDLSFTLCATFNQPSPDMAGRGAYSQRDYSYPSMGGVENENFAHDSGRACFERTIDPERYPPAQTLR